MNESRAARYQRLRRRADVVSAVAGAAVLGMCAGTGVGAWLASVAGQWAAPAPASIRSSVAVIIFVAVLAAALEAVAIPAVIYLGRVRDRRFKRADHATGALVSSQFHAAVVGVVSAAVTFGVGELFHVAST